MTIRRTFSAIALIAIACLQPATGEEIRDYYAEPGLNPFKETLNQHFSEHIDPFGGTLQLKYTDVHIPGNGGMDIDITRTYTSLQTNAIPAMNLSGLGWTMHFGRVVVSRENRDKMCGQQGYIVNTADNPSLELPDGGRELLVLSLLHGNDGTLITRSNWIARCLPSGQGMLVTAPNGTRYTMDRFDNFQGEPSYLTTRIEDVHGNWIAIDYATNATGLNYMSQIRRGEDGVVVTFEYEDADTNAIALSAIVAPGQRWTYEYQTIPGFIRPFAKQLVHVSGPEGQSWQYGYNPKMPDPNPEDELPELGIGSYSLNQVIYPHGATIDYTYQLVHFDPSVAIPTTAIRTKIVSGTHVQGGTWVYQFAPHSESYDDNQGGFLRYDVTTVTAPEATYRYKHFGKDYRTEGASFFFVRASFVGLLAMREIFEPQPSNRLIERTSYSWGQRKISNEDFWHGGVRTWWRDDGTYAPLLQGEYVSRDSAITGLSFAHARLYSEFDALGNPGKVFEHSNVAGQPARQVLQTYYNDLSRWIVGLLKNETYEKVVDSVATPVGTVEREFDLNGKLRRVVDFGNETQFTYTSAGDLETKRDARGKAVTYSDYKRGIARREVHPESVTLTRVVNDDGTLRSESNGRGFQTSYTYDGLHRLKSIDYPIKADVSIDYQNGAGFFSRVLARGSYIQSERINSFGQTLRIERRDTASGQSIARDSRFDALGRETFRSYPNDTIGTNTAYDALGRVVRITHPDGTFVRYEHDDARVVVRNERGFETTYSNHVFGVSYERGEPALISEPEDVGTFIKRDVLGNVVSLFQGQRMADGSLRGYEKTYEYDGRNLLVRSSEPEVGTTILGHDEVGNVISERVNDLPDVKFVYDGLNRRTGVDFSDTTPDVVTAYDKNGNIERITSASTEWFYVYDENDNLRSERLTINTPQLASRVYTLAYDYSDLDVTSAVTYPSGLVVDYAPDALGRPTKVGTFASNVTYHPSGVVASYRLANGVITNVGLNQRLMTQSIAAPGVVNLTYAYDAGGNVMSISDGLVPSKNVTMDGTSYDGLDRLRNVAGAWGNASFGYDYHGNFVNKDVGVNGMHYELDSQRRVRHVRRYDATSPGNNRGYLRFDYDSRGNAVARRSLVTAGVGSSIDEKLYDFDSASHLVRARANRIDGTGVTALVSKHYTYDGNGQRVVEHKDASFDFRFSIQGRGGILMFEDQVLECTRTDHIYLGTLSIAKSEDRPAVAAQDSDGDQIPDCIESQLGLNPNAADAAADADGDGLTNLQELNAGTSLTRADTDGDGLSDRDELQRDLTDPNSADTDGDGIADGVEAANPQLDPRLADKDHDGVSDFWELRLATNPASGADGLLDTDGDGFSNRQESAAKADPQLPSIKPKRGAALWEAHMVGVPGYSLGIGRDRTVYVSGSDSTLYAFFPDGTLRWKFVLTGQTLSDPTVGSDGTVYIATQVSGGILNDEPRSYVRAFNPEGTEKWIWPTDVFLKTPVTIGEGGRLYIGAQEFENGRLTGAIVSLSGVGDSELWQLENAPIVQAAAIGRGGEVYFTDSGGRLLAYSKTLQPMWRYQLRAQAEAPPSVADDGTVYVGDTGGYLYAINAGTLRWDRLLTEGRVLSSVTLGADGTLYVGGYQSRLFALDPSSGESRWEVSTSGTVFTPAIAMDGSIYATTAAGDLNAYSPSGSLLWEQDTATRAFSAPIVDRDGTIYFGSETGQIFAVGDNGGGPARTHWPMHRHDSAGIGYRCFDERQFSLVGDSDGDLIDDCAEIRYGLDPSNPADAAADADGDGLRNFEEHQRGTDLHSADSDGDGLNDSLEVFTYHTSATAADTDHDGMNDGVEIAIGTNPLNAGDTAADSDSDGFSNRQESLAGTDPLNASSRPAEGQLLRLTTNGSIKHVVVGRDGTIYLTTPLGVGSALQALHPDFTPKWSIPVSTDLPPVLGADGTIYVVEKRRDDMTRLLAYWPNGLLRWVHTVAAPNLLDGISAPPAIGVDGTIYFVRAAQFGSQATVHALDARGVPRANWPTAGAAFRGRRGDLAVAPSGNIVVYDSTLAASLFNPLGSKLWEHRVASPAGGHAVVSPDGTVYLSDGTSLEAVEPGTGNRRWAVGGVHGAPLIDAGNRVILYCGGAWQLREICAINPDGTFAWEEATGYDYFGSPVIDANGTVLAYAVGGRLVALNASGSVRWDVPVSPAVFQTLDHPVVLEDGIIYLPTAGANALLAGGARGWPTAPWPVLNHDYRSTNNAAEVPSLTPSPAPSVVITEPRASSMSVDLGEGRVIKAVASDLVDGNLNATVRWTSSIDGAFATGSNASVMPLSAGTHTVTASVTDSDGLTGSASIIVNKSVIPPPLSMQSPEEGQGFDVGETIAFEASALDLRDGDLGARIEWRSSRDGLLGSGARIERSTLSTGAHVITARVVDNSGTPTAISRSITVAPRGPAIALAAPADGEQIELGRPTTFAGSAIDGLDGIVTASMRWTSDRDGLIGTGGSFEVANLAAGAHVITVTATDHGGTASSLQFSIVVRHMPPTLSVVPPPATSYEQGRSVFASAQASDAKDGNLDDSIRWTSSLDGLIGSGASFSRNDLSVGTHQITASVTDSDGQIATYALPDIAIWSSANSAPAVEITAPAHSSQHFVGDSVQFRGVASDVQDGSLSPAIQWSSDRNGSLGTGASVATSGLGLGPHVIRAFVVDSAGGKAVQILPITILPTPANFPPTVQFVPFATGFNFAQSSVYPFTGIASDREDGNVSSSLRWSSDIDGALGTGSTVLVGGLSFGRHVISATATDSGGATGSSSFTVDVSPDDFEVPAQFMEDLFPDAGPPPPQQWQVFDEGTPTPSNWSMAGGRMVESSDAQVADPLPSDIPKRGTYLIQKAGAWWADYRLEARLRSTDDDALGLMFRYVDNDNYYRFSMDRERSYRRLVKKVNGVFTILWSDNTRFTANTNYELAITATGSQITLAIGTTVANRVQVFSGTDTSHRRGTIALYAWGENQAQFDNVRVFNLRTVASNDAPIVTIASPVNNSSSVVGSAIAFNGSALDFEDGAMSQSIAWVSSRDGSLGTGAAINVSSLTVGAHVITARATDSRGASGTATLNLTVNEPFNNPPTLNVASPAEGATFNVGTTATFTGTASDVEDGTISNGITWTSSRSGALGSGASLPVNLVAGAHTITARIQDSGGKFVTVTRNITVAVPGNNQPTVTLTAPLNGTARVVGDSVALSATASDIEDGNLTGSISWSSSINGALGTGGVVNTTALTGGVHTITARVNDSMGGTRSVSSSITIVPTAAVLLREDFNDGNFNGWTATTQGTVSAPAAWAVSSGVLQQTSDVSSTPTNLETIPKLGTFLRYGNSGTWSNYSVTAELRSSDNDTLGVMFRHSVSGTAHSYYRFSMDSERASRRLTKLRSNGAWLTLWEDTTAFTPSRWYVFEAIANGTTLTIKLDGVQLWTGTDSTNGIASGSVAMYSWQNTGAQFDNVLVRNLSVPLSSSGQPRRGLDRVRKPEPMLARDEPRRGRGPAPRRPPERVALITAVASESRQGGGGVR